MGSRWPLVKLESIAEVIDSRHQTPIYSDVGYPMVRVVDVKGGVLQLEDTKKVSQEVYDDFSKGRDPIAGDLVISRVGSYGNVSYVSSEEKFCLGQNTALIIPKDKNRFLYYALISPQVKDQIEQVVVGAVQKTLSLKCIKNLDIPQPPEEIKKGISDFISEIDDKITLNRQINQTLEQMAQTLFKSWFVDFDPVIDNALDAGNDIPDTLLERAEQRRLLRAKADFKPLPAETRALFPSEFEETELGWVPKGWSIPRLNDFVDVTDFVANGSFAALKENVELKDIPDFAIYVRTTDFKSDFSEDNLKYVDENAFKFLKKSELKGDEVIISNVGDVGTVFRPPVWLNMPMTLGSNAISCNSKLQNHYLYCFFSNHAGQHLIDGIVSGSAQQKFNKTGFRSLQIPLPSEPELIEFNRIYDELNLKSINTKKEIIILNKLKNIMLPKLISGELDLDALPELPELAEAR